MKRPTLKVPNLDLETVPDNILAIRNQILDNVSDINSHHLLSLENYYLANSETNPKLKDGVWKVKYSELDSHHSYTLINTTKCNFIYSYKYKICRLKIPYHIYYKSNIRLSHYDNETGRIKIVTGENKGTRVGNLILDKSFKYYVYWSFFSNYKKTFKCWDIYLDQQYRFVKGYFTDNPDKLFLIIYQKN